MTVGPAELAFYAARAALGGEALVAGLQVSLEDRKQATIADIVAALEQAPKPARISGVLNGSRLHLRIGPALAERDDRALGDEPPLLAAAAADETALLIVAFDELLLVTKSAWRSFRRQFQIDAPISWSADEPGSEFVRGLKLPRARLQGVAVVVVLGAGVPQGFLFPVKPRAWDLP